MDLRRATPDDADAIAGIYAVVAPEGSIGAEAPVDVEARAAMLRTSIGEPAGSSAVWVLDDAGRVLGFAAARPSVPGVLSLSMVLLPEARGGGHGRALLDAVVAHATAVGGHKVDLEVWTDNARAIALYARAGFTVEGLRDRHYRRRDGTLRSSLIMARRLDRARFDDGGPGTPGR